MKQYQVSGYLAPDGEFYECEYMGHQNLAEYLVSKYQVNTSTMIDWSNDIALGRDFIKFGASPWVAKKEGTGQCHVFVNSEAPITIEQIQWLKDNLHMFTDEQIHYLSMSPYIQEEVLV